MTMTDPLTTAEIARRNMVDSQVRPNQVNDARVIAAMRHIPREFFVPPSVNAYADTDIDLGDGRFMLAPMTIARLTQLVLAGNPQHILVIAAGSGYGAAILAASGPAVTALESEPRLQSKALAAVAPSVSQVTGPLKAGWPATGPYDVILIEGAVQQIPSNLAAQLVPGGRVIAILADLPGIAGPRQAALGRAVIGRASGNQFATAAAFDCAARILPEFQQAPAFSF